ncbi:MAG TPA: sigma-70 family RNA polymerase sigma factor [Gemmataceae bacterium]|nr:sigma-70 family RNA polymerase sigma factor [Gemmataceae bacterium]
MSSSQDPSPAGRPCNDFTTTHWSLVLKVGQRGNRAADEALAELCQRYWFPLYAFVRRRVGNVHEAQDVTQEFFAFLLEEDALAQATPERGRFRSFLLAALKNFQANQWDRANTRKRGGGRKLFSLEFDMSESRLSLEPAHGMTPEHLFERQWALTLLDLIMTRLQKEYATSGKGAQFELLKGVLIGDKGRPYAELARELNMSEPAARQAGFRLRKRYRELLRQEVAQTVADVGDVEEEIRSLFQALGG